MDLVDEKSLKATRDKIARLFKFVRALYDKRNPPPRQVSEQPWILRFSQIPEHESIELLRYVDSSTEETAPDDDSREDQERVILRVRRPILTPPPEPAEALREWLTDSYHDSRKSVDVFPSKNLRGENGVTQVIYFDSDPNRVEALSAFNGTWRHWADRERVAIAAGDIFGSLYTLHGNLQRESEQFQLVLGDGVLVWRRPDGGVRFPLLLRELRLEFDAEIPEFRIIDSGMPTEFYSAIFRSMADVEGKLIGQIREDAEKLDLHPLGLGEVDGFLRRVVATLSSRGEFNEAEPGPERDNPVIGRSASVFLRKRTLGFSMAIDSIIEDVLQASEFPESLLNIVGIGLANEEVEAEAPIDSSTFDANEDGEVLFTKPANAEQLQIARNLDHYNCVLVQGPPGTGKTHTIANLLGHLLAQGKSVLVTSHRTKALRVLRDMVVAELQPLCLSVLDEDAEDGDRLKSSVDGIVERLGMSNAVQLGREENEFDRARRGVLETIARLRTEIREARLDEQRYIITGGEGTLPIDAARFVAEHSATSSWIPAPVTLGEPMPLSADEIMALYQTNATVSVEDEQTLDFWIPDPNELTHPNDFEKLVDEQRSFEDADRTFGSEFWLLDDIDVDSIENLYKSFEDAIAALDRLPDWMVAVVNAAISESGEVAVWEALVVEIQALHAASVAAQELLVTHDPQLPPMVDLERVATTYKELVAEIESGGKLSFLTLLIKKDWKVAIESGRVGQQKKPDRLDHFVALQTIAEISIRRNAVRARWERQVALIGGPSSEGFGAAPEARFVQWLPAIKEALTWFQEVWQPLQLRLLANGLNWNAIKSRVDTQSYDIDPCGRLRVAVHEYVLPTLIAKGAQILWEELQRGLAEARARCIAGLRPAPLALEFVQAVDELAVTRYRSAFEELLRLHRVALEVKRRRESLERLARVAPTWARSIRTRDGRHREALVPGDPGMAWKWRQYHDELARRDQVSLPDLMRELDAMRTQLKEVTAQLVDRKAWRYQQGRTGLAERQALNGWYLANKKIGKGTGKRVPVLRRLARSLMTEAQAAVPVWIMPMVKVAESYDPKKSKFDVVIVDEASQSDVTGLFAFYLGKQIIVVGDDEQVSPDAVGERVEETQHLIDEYLQGIPLADLYDGRQSIYDLAKQAFGGTICLLEHFRCVPDIIRFSNALSYNGRIKPLREAASTNLAPATLSYRVDSATAAGRVNEQEARTVAALVCATTELPEYFDKTFGIISMVGEDQARRIEEIIRAQLTPAEIERRRLLAGNAAQFQGDERDVVFLSLVDTSEGAPLSLRQQPLFKKRFNVAASRAKDQMWVVHSLDPGLDLKPDDLRRLLIEHAMNPTSTALIEKTEGRRVESPFELEVFRRLVAAGYRVKSQVPVGAYRIDMVVEGSATRLAVECDGDRYHRLEDLDRDLSRQAILERLGWRFVRIRGSQFYRDRDKALAPLFHKLAEMDILPLVQGPLSSTEPTTSDVAERVRARVAELLADPAFGELVPTAPKRGGRLWNGSRARGRPPENGSAEGSALVASEPAPDQAMRATPTLIERLKAESLSVVDNRPKGGSLWVIGDSRLGVFFGTLKKQGITFVYSENGSRATNNQPAWFTTNHS